MPMIYTDVNSTAIASIGYDPVTWELVVVFLEGGTIHLHRGPGHLCGLYERAL